MTTYVDVFTGSNIYPTDISLTKVDLTASITLWWPQEAQPNQPIASSIVQIDSSTAANWVITMPDARRTSIGDTTLFNNLSSQVVIINDAGGTQIVSLDPGTQWQIYLANNTTLAGVFEVYQFGAGTSTANASALAGAGLKAINSRLAQSANVTGFTSSFALADTDRAQMFNFELSAAGVTVTLPDPSVVGNDWFVQLRNSGEASISLVPFASETIDGLSSLTFNPGFSAFILCDGTNYYTVGFGQGASFAFEYIVVDLDTVATDYVLAGSELNRVGYGFEGTLGASITVIVPPTVQQYWVYNNTVDNGDVLSIATAAQKALGNELALVRGDHIITYCDGSDVWPTSAAAVVGAINGGTF
jgi:hypothetical protein